MGCIGLKGDSHVARESFEIPILSGTTNGCCGELFETLGKELIIILWRDWGKVAGPVNG